MGAKCRTTALVLFALAGSACGTRPDHGEPLAASDTTPAGARAQSALMDRQLVRSVSISLDVRDVDAARKRVVSITEGAGGFVESLDSTRYGDTRQLQLKLRLPKDKLDALLAQLRALGDVRHESQAIEDVTRAYVDTDARLRNLDRTEQRLISLLGKPDAALADVIAVERELSRVRGEIEIITAELRTLKERVALSKVELAFTEDAALVAAPSVWLPWHRLWRDAGGMVAGSLRSLIAAGAALVAGLLYALPWLPVAGGLWYGLRRLRARRRR
jgi:acetolactate synthase regulatory subunit